MNAGFEVPYISVLNFEKILLSWASLIIAVNVDSLFFGKLFHFLKKAPVFANCINPLKNISFCCSKLNYQIYTKY